MARPVTVLIAVLTVILIGMTTWSVVLGLSVWEQRRLEAQRHEILHTARQETVNLLSLNYRTIDRDIDDILSLATGKFRDEFASRTGTLKRFITKVETASTTKIHSAGIASIDDDSAQALVVVDQTVRGPKNKEGFVKYYRLSLTLEQQDGRWLVSNLRYVS